jgi:raffinose/stachyose/melibiose transport system substrate-binding protein
MRRQTRRTSVAVGAVAITVALTACAPGTGQSSAPKPQSTEISTDISGVGEITLTVWDQEVRGAQNEQIEQLNAAFEKKYPNVTIDRVSQAFDDLNTTLRLALTDKDAPDVVQANNGRNTMGAFVAADQLRPLDDYADAYGWFDRYAESILQYSTYSDDATVFGEGDLYGLPQVGEVVGVFYSKSKLEGLGVDVPRDWAAFEKALAVAKAAGEIPIQLGNIEQWPAGHVFGPLQGGYVDADEITKLGLGNPGASWTTPENEKAAAALQSWVKNGYLNEGANGTDYDAAWQALAAGDGVFLLGGSWLTADLADAMDDDLGFFVPETADGSPATTGGTGLPFTITSAAENTDVAAAYIDFVTNDAAMEILAETGNLPVNRTAELAPASGVLADVYQAFEDVTRDGSLLPYLDYATPTFGDTLGQSLQDLIDGRTTPKQFTEALEADYAEFLTSNG